MLDNKKVLGLCITKIQDRVRADLVDKLNQAALDAGFKLICFNSFEDFYTDNGYAKGARTIYDGMDFDALDGVVICREHFCDSGIVEGIAARAKEKNVPVVILNGSVEDCISVTLDCEKAFKELVRHLIRHHQVTDLFFVAGKRDQDPNSELRFTYYREVLEECGISFDPEKMDYGEYWDEPAMRITERLVKGGNLPQAIVCANDIMAFAVCRELKYWGYSVPEDVIVTGFDGVPAVDYYYPRLSTCREDRRALATQIIKVFEDLFAGRPVKEAYKIPYELILSESCGCVKPALVEKNEEAATLYRMLEDMESHENYVTSQAEEMLGVDTINDLFQPLAKMLHYNSWLCLGSRFMRLASSEKWEDGKTVLVPSTFNENAKLKYGRESDMLPETEEWLRDETCYVISAVYSKEFYFGYLAVKADRVGEVHSKYTKISRLMNLIFTSLLHQLKQREMMQSMEDVVYRDPLTGLPNLKGASKWFEEFASVEGNHKKSLSISIYAVPQYSQIYEKYGIHAVEEVVTFVAEQLKAVCGRDCFLARNSENEFLCIRSFTNPQEIPDSNEKMEEAVQRAMESFQKTSGQNYSVEVSMGHTVADAGWTGSLGAFVKYASNEMFLNRLQQNAAEKVTAKASHADYFSVFNLLLENNLFTYHFQPIVNAKNGEIYGYEALMRTAGGITLTPMEILEAAREYKRLDEIEHATMYNVLNRYDEEYGRFQGRKVFINTIPNHFLSAQECEELSLKYQQYMQDIVFEVTEQDSSSDEEVEAIKRFCGGSGITQIAIDDYGTGHSNIVNLLRYAPQIIKIDRYLISGIESDLNKQMFLKNTIEFAAMNQIKVLAEGVETAEELRTVIEFGVDMIQGFFTGRPAADPVEEIDEKIKNMIIQENLKLSRYNNDKQKVYTAKPGETINLINLALQKYNYLQIVSGEVNLVSKKDSRAEVIIRVSDNADVKLNVHDVNVSGTDEPAIQLGKGSNVEMRLQGYNSVNKNGILVPKGARLHVTGEGRLLVNGNNNPCVGIGSYFNDAYGEIILEAQGMIKVISSADKLVGIGGGYSSSPIVIGCGQVEVTGSGISVVGIGSSMGDAYIQIGEAEITIKESGNEAVGIGTITGTARIASKGQLGIISDGERSVGIGTLFGNNGIVELEKGSVNAVVHCDVGSVIGSVEGNISVNCRDCDVTVYGEGSEVTGVGSSQGCCVTEITGGIVDVKVLSGGAQPFGNEKDRIVITGGNVIDRNDTLVTAQNAYGQILHRECKEGDRFEQVISTERGEYVYSATRSQAHEILSVYLP